MNKQSKVLKNAAILFAAAIITKFIGAALRIPLTNILGGLGMGYFSTAYNLYSPVYAVTAAALPTVIMRMVARQSANSCDPRKIRRAGLAVALGLGLCGTIGMLIIAAPFANLVAGSPNSLPAMLVIAPSLLFCCFAAIYKGYYEGLNNMLPTAISQIVEAVVKAVAGIALAVVVVSRGGEIHYAAAAAIAGITVSEFFGLLSLFIRSKLDPSAPAAPSAQSCKGDTPREIARTILRESFPITIAALTMNLNPLIDMMTITAVVNAYPPESLPGALAGIPDPGSFMYGSYSGITIPIFAIATTITAMVCKSSLPEITAAAAKSHAPRLHRSVKILFKGTFMTGLPLCLGLAALAQPFLSLLYFSKPAEVLLSTPPLVALGLGGIPILMSSALFGIFLAIDRVDLQIKLMLGGAAIKLAANMTLVRIPHINITGAAFSTVLCYLFISVVGLACLKRSELFKSAKLNIAGFVLRPLVFSLLCAATARYCHAELFADRSPVLNLAMSIAAGAAVYLTLTMFSDRKYLLNLIPDRGEARHRGSLPAPRRGTF